MYSIAGLPLANNSNIRRIPKPIWFVAAAASLLHLMPIARAIMQTPPGWRFTGNVRSSVDFMQYRVWMRQSQEDGLLVSNRFTSEPNPPHLPVPQYVLLGRLSHLIGVQPEWLFATFGALLAFVFVLLLFSVVRAFFPIPHQTGWTFFIILLGGGLGALLKLLRNTSLARDSHTLRMFLVDPLRSWMLFEDYRGHYVFDALFDAHFLLLWTAALAAVMAFHHALRALSIYRLLMAAVLFGLATFLHVYEGVTLLAIAGGIVLVCRHRNLVRGSVWLLLFACAVAVALCMIWQWSTYRRSGLPMSPWRAPPIPLMTLLLAYPIAWLLIVIGLPAYWRRAGLNECMLLGWAAGCAAVTLSGPFYPYPDRGTLTMQIALYLIAAGIYFSRQSRITLPAAAMAITLLGVTPIWQWRVHWKSGRFDADAPRPHVFSDQAHEQIIQSLRQSALLQDLLLAEPEEVLWLAPEFPGRHYCGHFFLTVNHDEKREQVRRFYEKLSADDRGQFLAENGIRFVFVGTQRHPEAFKSVTGLRVLQESAAGVLFDYSQSNP